MSKEAIETATWAWENRSAVKRGLKRLYKWLTSDSRGLLVLGTGGTGKSTFGRIFARKSEGLFERLADYEESLGVETVTFADHGGLEAVILPGQSHRRAAIWPKFTEAIRNGKYRGILLFNSFGYHSLGEISYRQTEQFVTGMKPKAFVEAYVQARRDQEIAVLKEISPYLETSLKPIWLLNVVTKEDLWWDQRTEVEQWYRTGPIPQILEQLVVSRGATRFHTETAYVSFLIRNFVTGHDELLAKTVGGYDQALQLTGLRRFVESLDSLRMWEQAK